MPENTLVKTAQKNGRRAGTSHLLLALALPALIAGSVRANVGGIAPTQGVEKASAAPVAAAAVPAYPVVSVPAVSAPKQAAAVPAVIQQAVEPKLPEVAGLSPEVLRLALDAKECAQAQGASGRDDLLTVIDYSLPSTEKRLWVLDLAKGEVLFHELVAHGQGSGDNYATRFSNTNDSHQTSLGLFVTGGTYHGGNGYSLRLKGLSGDLNDRAEARHIVMHGAWYVSDEHARRQGRLGRSWGCPALSQEIAPTVIDTIKGGSFVFSYAASQSKVVSASLNSCPTNGGGNAVTTALAAR
jgi:hypothetical protein